MDKPIDDQRDPPAAPASPSTASRESRPALYTAPFIGVVLITLLAFSQNFAIQPIIPLLVLERGGDAALVGIVFAVYSIPSLALRPYIGQLADRFGSRRILLAGTLGIALAGPAYVVGNLPVILVNRVFHGTAWAAINTGGPSLMARLAPASRRGEAAGIFDLMPGIALLVMPSVGLLLYANFGTSGAFVVAALLGVAAVAIVALIPAAAEVQAPARPSSSSRSLLEPTAILPMLLQLLFTSVVSLFLVYPPLFAAKHGIPINDLTAYYPIYGVTLVVSRLLTGRVIDRLPRTLLMAAGAVCAAIALLVASVATTLPMLVVAGAIYAAAAGFSSPAITAVVIDRSPSDRLGSAMATYTLGYQFGTGIGAAIWGFVIDDFDFMPAFLAGAAIQLVMLGLVVRSRVGLTEPVGGHRLVE